MKEQIYTIPVNEVYDTDCECPLCELEKKLEKETLDYALGAAMMDERHNAPANFCPDAAVSDITVDVVSEVQRASR